MPFIKLRIPALAGGTIFIWGLSWIAYAVGQRVCSPLLLAALACSVGVIVVFPFMIKEGSPGWKIFFLAGIWGVGGLQLFGQMALHYAGAGETTLLTYSMPFWALATSWFLFREPVSQKHWLALIIAGAGLVVAVAPWQTTKPSILVGDGLALAGGAAWGTATSFSRQFMLQHPNYSPMALGAWQILGGAVALWISVALIPTQTLTPTFPLGMVLLYTGILCGPVAWWMWNRLVQELPVAGSGVISMGVPVVGVLAAWPLLGEKPPIHEIIGLLLVVVAIALLSLRQDSAASAPLGDAETQGLDK